MAAASLSPGYAKEPSVVRAVRIVSARESGKRPATSVGASICNGKSLVSSDFRHVRGLSSSRS
jgi:hypothetical protein